MLESHFRVIPVLDVKNGQAVHAVGGIRSHYRPLRSILHPSVEPVELARAYRDLFDFRELYLADLDAISGQQQPDLSLYRELAIRDVHLWIDAGLKNENDLAALVDLDHTTIVIGLETAHGPDAVRAILERAGPDRVVLSLDLFEGVPRLPVGADWAAANREQLSRQILDLGVLRLLLLDLSRVGTGRGTGTDELLLLVRQSHPAVEVSVGGGISGMEDLLALRTAGAAAVLVGSALHDGRIGREQLDRLAANRESPCPPPFTHSDVHTFADESPSHSTSAD
jgi:phosphoribosylformimino-5-aminoimidazole carboxamide ribotide isomerase